MLSDVNQVARKLVVGLRQVAGDMNGQVERRMKDTSVEAKGFLSEAVDQYADRINGIASELAAAVGYVEASADLIAARKIAVEQFLKSSLGDHELQRYVIMAEDGTGELAVGDERAIVRALTNGELDASLRVTSVLAGIAQGRELAAADQRAVMMAPPAAPTQPSRLTITVDGPYGSGKTRWATWLARTAVPSQHTDDPVIIEMRDGRPFNVRNDAFEG